MTEQPKPYELWYAEVAYEDDPESSSDRPVLVIDNQLALVLSLKITTHPPREEFWGEIPIRKWEASGLKQLSTIRVSKLLRLEEKDFRRKIGDLHPIDIASVQNYIDRIYGHNI